MSPYPKHYLADVPQDLRLRVLDLCIHRQWHDALDLLHQNGFTQYEWYELVWFHDHAPANLDPIPPASTGSTGDTETLTGSRMVSGQPNLNSRAVKVRKPRSKIARLPIDIQHHLNAMLAGGRPYPEIIHWLNTHGYPGFNKVNLHSWKTTALQDWLRLELPTGCVHFGYAGV